MLSKKFFLLTGCSIFVVLILITYKGLGSTADAEAYWYAAQSFRKSYTFLTPFGYYTNWPPLFPLLIYILGVPWVQYVAFAFNAFLLYQMGGLVLHRNSIWHFLFFVQSTSGVMFLMIHFFLWSEAWFLVFLLALLGGYIRLVQKNYSKKLFFSIILLANLLCLQRMAGIFFVLAFTVLIARHFSIKKAGIFAVASSIGVLAWFLRNSFLQSKPDFLDNIFVVSWWQSLSDYSKALFNNFFPTYWFSEMWSIILLIGLMLFLLVLVIREKLVISSLTWLCLCYLVAMLALRMNIAGESERYLAPIQPLFLLIFWHFAEKWSQKEPLKKIAYIALFVILTFQLLRTAKNVRQWWQSPPNLILKLKTGTTQCYTISSL